MQACLKLDSQGDKGKPAIQETWMGSKTAMQQLQYVQVGSEKPLVLAFSSHDRCWHMICQLLLHDYPRASIV